MDPQPHPSLKPDLLEGLDPGELLARGLQTAQLSADAAAWVAPDPEELAKLLPQYQIERLLGRGGMGAVYKGLQSTLDRPVAIKLLSAELAADETFVSRFEREARILAKLQHPDIVSIYEFGKTSAGHLFFVMEYVDGTDLKQILDTTGLDFEQALLVVSRICEALHAAHQQGVVHRDIKPANVLITKNGDVKLVDFGLARPAHENAEGLTATNVVMGTPQYMAPEQHEGHADCRTDIFALGVMLYEMVTGQTPRGFFEPPSRKVQVDVRIDGVVLKALQEEPSRRYQHASEMGTDVDQIRNSPTAETVAEPAAQPAPAPPSRNRKPIAIAAAAAAIILISAVALLSTKKDGGAASAGTNGATASSAKSDSPPPVIKGPAKADATPFSRMSPSTPAPRDLAPRSATTTTQLPHNKNAPSSTISPLATSAPRIIAGSGSAKPDPRNGGAATLANASTPKTQSSPTRPSEDALFEKALVDSVWSWIPGVSNPHESELIFHQDGSVLCANATGRWKIGGRRNVTLSFQGTPVVLNFDETVQRFTGFSEGARSIVFTGALKRSAAQPAATPPPSQIAAVKKESPAPSVEQAPKSTPNPQPKDGFFYTTGFEAPIFPVGKFRKANATAVGDGHWSVLPEGPLEVDRAVRIQNTISHGGSQALMIDAGPGKAIQMEVIGSFENSEPFVSIQADIFLQSSSKQSDWDISFGDPEIGGHLQAGGFNIIGGNGHLQIMTDGYPQNMTAFPRDAWTHIELRMNMKTQSFDILLNGSPLATKVPFIAHTSRIRHFIFGDFAHGNDRMYIDNISFTGTKTP